MDQYFGDYLGESEDHALAYELEYVLAGKGSDKENLESVIKRLLFVREAANITHILGDGDKRAKTLGMAEALAGIYRQSGGCAARSDGSDCGVGVCGEYSGHPCIAGRG